MIRTAILGLGNVAERIHLPACRSIGGGIEVVAASEPREERREEMRRRFGIPRVYEDSFELIEREKPELVIVGTPPDSHYELALASLRAGADVLCEKPFMKTVDEARAVIGEARRCGRRIAVNTQYRHMSIYARPREAIHRGDFGRLFFLQCWQQMFHPPAFEPLEWRRALRQSTLFEFGAHPLDLITTFFDGFPEAITATIPRARADFDSDVLIHLVLRFPGDRVATVCLNRVTHAPERYLEMRLDCEEGSLRISLGGVARAGVDLARHRGGLRLRPRISYVRGGEVRLERDGRSRPLVREKSPMFASATAVGLARLAGSVERGESPDWRDAVHALNVLRLVFAGYESAATGRTVPFEAE